MKVGRATWKCPCRGKLRFQASVDTPPALSSTRGGAGLGWDVGHCQNPRPPTVCDGTCCQATGLRSGPESQGQPPTSRPAISGLWGLPGAS